MRVNIQCITLIDDNFQREVLEAQALVLVDCWASWCGSLQQINPIFEELAIEFAEHIKIARLNVAVSQKLSVHYGIRAVPTLLLFNAGQVVGRVIGGVSKPTLVNKLNALLTGNDSSRSQIACL